MYRLKAIITLSIVILTFVGVGPTGRATLPPDDGLLAPDPPTVTASSWILYDSTFGKTLAEERADERVAMASTTKIMTALVVIEQTLPDDEVAISERAASVGESRIGLIAGEEPWTVKDLLAALILRSANDAAVALAEHVGGSVAGFSDLMNDRASRLGLQNSRFVNPHGLDHPDHYSSARDLLILSLVAMEIPRFAGLVATRSAHLPDAPDGTPRVTPNRNKLLADYPGALGIKTGYTSRAQLTFVAAAERAGRRIYAVVLGSTQHYEDAAALLDYGFAEFGPMTLVPVTSEDRRPLFTYFGIAEEAGFELFIAPVPIEDLPEGQPGVDHNQPPARVDDPGVRNTENPPAEAASHEQQESAATAGHPVERQAHLPGLREAVTWFRHYWNRIANPTSEAATAWR